MPLHILTVYNLLECKQQRALATPDDLYAAVWAAVLVFISA